ncbi:MAG: four helix bundle protein [Armatimonadota bacterium]|nr:four helix bundle protein [Armatimonadota bacterium]
MIDGYRNLKVWQAGMEMCVLIYEITRDFPKSEAFCLVPQMRRAAASVPGNIAEGYARDRKAEFIRFLQIAKGSLSELGTYVDLSGRLGYLDATTATPVSQKINALGGMLYNLIASVKQKQMSECETLVT